MPGFGRPPGGGGTPRPGVAAEPPLAEPLPGFAAVDVAVGVGAGVGLLFAAVLPNEPRTFVVVVGAGAGVVPVGVPVVPTPVNAFSI